MNDMSVLQRMNEVCESMVEMNKLDELGIDEVMLFDELYDELMDLQRQLFTLLDLEGVS